MSFFIRVHFGSNEPEDFGLDLGHFPLELHNNITNEKLRMEININSFFIGRMPNDVVDWQWPSDYMDSILRKIPSISIGKWV